MQHALRLTLRIAATLVCAIVFRGLPRAQDITANELLAPIGTTYGQYAITDLFPWDTLQGAGVLWDYSWVTVDSTVDITFEAIDPASAPAIGDHPTSNRVVRSTQGTNDDYIIDRFYEQQADRLVELGSAGPVLSYAYDMPETVYGLPMQLGDTLHGNYCVWSDGLGAQYHFCGNSFVTHDATGTLVLPFDTYTNVKHVTQWRSSFETTGTDTDTTHFVRQQWFAPGMAFPVLEVIVSIYSDGTMYPSGRVIDAGGLVGTAELVAGQGLTAFPVPTSGPITIQRTNAGAADVHVYDVSGSVVAHADFGHGAGSMQLSLEGLPAGLYLLRVTDAAGSSALRVVKQ